MNKENLILNAVIDMGQPASSEIFEYISKEAAVSLPTVKRILASLVDEGKLVRMGAGRNTRYALTPSFRIFGSIDMEQYFEEIFINQFEFAVATYF